MAISDRIYKVTDRPMTWTRAIVLGLVIWIAAILLLGQLPSWIIYKVDQELELFVDWSRRLPGVGTVCAALGSGGPPSEGCNPTQILIVRDLVANGVQMGALVAMLVGAYVWQQKKRKRTGGRGVEDVVKGYMPGK